MTLEEARLELIKFVELKTTQRPLFLDVILKATEPDCERCLQVTERPGNDICKACGGRRGQDATRMEENDLRDLRE